MSFDISQGHFNGDSWILRIFFQTRRFVDFHQPNLNALNKIKGIFAIQSCLYEKMKAVPDCMEELKQNRVCCVFRQQAASSGWYDLDEQIKGRESKMEGWMSRDKASNNALS